MTSISSCYISLSFVLKHRLHKTGNELEAEGRGREIHLVPSSKLGGKKSYCANHWLPSHSLLPGNSSLVSAQMTPRPNKKVLRRTRGLQKWEESSSRGLGQKYVETGAVNVCTCIRSLSPFTNHSSSITNPLLGWGHRSD